MAAKSTSRGALVERGSVLGPPWRDGCLLARPRVCLTCATLRPAGAHVCGETAAATHPRCRTQMGLWGSSGPRGLPQVPPPLTGRHLLLHRGVVFLSKSREGKAQVPSDAWKIGQSPVAKPSGCHGTRGLCSPGLPAALWLSKMVPPVLTRAGLQLSSLGQWVWARPCAALSAHTEGLQNVEWQ